MPMWFNIKFITLYSTYSILLDFQMSLYSFSFSCSGHFFHTVLFHISWGGATLSQINSLGSIQVCHLIMGNTSFSFHLSMQHSFAHSLMADRSIVVGHILMVHTFFYVQQLYRHDSTHPSHFMSWGTLWEPLVCSYDISHSRTWQVSITSLAATTVCLRWLPIQVLTGLNFSDWTMDVLVLDSVKYKVWLLICLSWQYHQSSLVHAWLANTSV